MINSLWVRDGSLCPLFFHLYDLIWYKPMQTLHKLPQSLWDSMCISLVMYWRPWFLGVLHTLLFDRISELWRECFDEYFPFVAEYSKSLTLSILWGYVSLYFFPFIAGGSFSDYARARHWSVSITECLRSCFIYFFSKRVLFDFALGA